MRQQARRSWLLVPADKQDHILEAARAGADVVVLDLEDTVHDSKKHDARRNIKEAIGTLTRAGAEVFVRSDVELLYADLEASVWRGITGVLLPKVTSAAQVKEADTLLAEFEARRGVVRPPPVGEILEADDPRGPEQALELHLCLDTGRGNWDGVLLIQASPRVRSVSLGRADLVMDLRPEPSGDIHMLPYLSQRLVAIAHATGVQPVGAWWREGSRGLSASGEDTLKAAALGRQAGFKGALCMKPHQVAALHQGFTPTEAERSRAAAIDLAYRQARERGASSTVVDGEYVDAGRADGARALLAWAEACDARDRARAVVAQGR